MVYSLLLYEQRRYLKMLDLLNTLFDMFTDAYSKDILYGVANLFTIVVGICTIVLPIINKLNYEYKLKHLTITDRPDWLSEEEFYKHTHNYIKTRVINSKGKNFSFKKFIKSNILKNRKQYHLILGESGTGKSTFLLNLYAKLNCKTYAKGYKVNCISLRMSDAIFRIKNIEDPKKVILLLDAFDEAREANIDANLFLNELEQNTQSFAKVVITSRNNFFDSDDSVPVYVNINRILQLDMEQYNRYYIQPFTICDVIVYILRKYKFLLHKIINSLYLVCKCKDVMCRPLILSYIDLLIKDKAVYKISSDIYEHLIRNWIKRETLFISAKNGKSTEFRIEEQMMELINNIAIFMYENYSSQNDYFILIEDLKKINNAEYLEHIDGKRNRSLFDRIDNKLVFSHRSLFEYLLAINFEKLSFRYESNLNILYGFLKEMGGNNWNSKYSSLFHVHYRDENLRRIENSNYDNTIIFESIISFSDRNYIYDMNSWYCNAICFPVFVKKEIYNRLKIEFSVNKLPIGFINNDFHDSISLTDHIMRSVKKFVAKKELVLITVKSYLNELTR